MKVSEEVLRLDRLKDPQRELLLDELAALDAEIFMDRTPGKTRAKVRGDHSDESWILLIREAGRLVGYNNIRVSFGRAAGGRFALWNSRSGLLPGFRGYARTGNFPLRFYFRFRRRHPTVPIYGLITLIHPSSFRMFANRIPNMYPFSKKPLSRRQEEVFDAAYQMMGLEPISGKPRFVVRDNTVTITNAVESEYWLRSSDPSIRFFHRHNSEYLQGQAIATFFRISLSSIIAMGVRHLGFRDKISRLGSKSARQLQMLREVPIFSHLSPASLRALLRETGTRRISAGEVLFHQGERQGEMFLLIKGTLMVEIETEGGSQTIAHLQYGDPVGEFGMLFNDPRNATVRAFRQAELLCISREAMEKVWQTHPESKGHLMRIVAGRIAENYLRQMPTYAQLRQEEIFRLVRQGKWCSPEATLCDSFPQPSLAVICEGQIKMNGKTIEAPAVVPLAPYTTISFHTESPVLIVPLPVETSSDPIGQKC